MLVSKNKMKNEQLKVAECSVFKKYSLVFLLMSAVIFSMFLIAGRSFIWNLDGAAQHYPILKKFHTLVWEWLQQPNKFATWDFTVGLGADIYNTFSYYVLGDIFTYLTLLFPENWLEFAYHFMIMLRLYLVGIAFIFYARNFKVSSNGLLAGSISYVFCGYIATVATRHPMFITPLILMPLLFLGIEKVLAKKSPFLFIIIVTITLISNFYFAYVLAILALCYWLFRYFTAYRNSHHFGVYTLKLISYSLISTLIASVVLIPTILTVLSASRLGGEFANGMLFFTPQHYSLLTKTLISTSGINQVFWTSGGYSVIVLFALPFICRRRKEYPGIFWSLTVGLMMLMLPAFGALFNALSTPSNRWTFALGLPISLSIMFFVSRVKEFNRQDLKVSSIVIILFLLTLNYKVYWDQLLVPLLVLLMIYIVLWRYVNSYSLSEKIKKMGLSQLFVILIGINLCFVQMYYYLGDSARYLGERLPIGEINQRIEESYDGVEKSLDFSEGNRAATVANYPEQGRKMNYSMLLNAKMIDSYYTLQSDSTYQLAQNLRIFGSRASKPIASGNERTAFYHSLGVKYLLANKKMAHHVPYSYHLNPELSKGETLVYETTEQKPFMYTTNQLMLTSEFEKLTPLDKERALLANVVVDNKTSKSDRDSFVSPIIPISSSLDDIDKLVFSKGNMTQKIRIEKPESTKESEVYLKIKGLKFKPNIKQNGLLGLKEQLKTPQNRMSTQDPLGFKLSIESEGVVSQIKGGNRSSLSGGEFTDEYLINLGYYKDGLAEFSFESEQMGTYDVSSIEILASPFTEEYDNDIKKIQSGELSDITLDNSYVSGVVEAKSKTFVNTLIPYSKGWQVFIDNKEGDIVKTNLAFVGVEVPQGQHQIEFKYQTPGLKIGFLLSCTGVLSLIPLYYFRNKKTRT